MPGGAPGPAASYQTTAPNQTRRMPTFFRNAHMAAKIQERRHGLSEDDQTLIQLGGRVDLDLGPRSGADLPGQRLGGLTQADGHVH